MFFKLILSFYIQKKVCDCNHRYFFLLEEMRFLFLFLINSTSDFVEEYELLFRYA